MLVRDSHSRDNWVGGVEHHSPFGRPDIWWDFIFGIFFMPWLGPKTHFFSLSNEHVSKSSTEEHTRFR